MVFTIGLKTTAIIQMKSIRRTNKLNYMRQQSPISVVKPGILWARIE